MKKKFEKQFVIVAGFPRCGSTYLYNILKQHPDITVSTIKEVNFFNKTPKYLSNPNIVSKRSLKSFDWYLKLFDLNKKVAIDFSILTSYDINSIERIKEKLGNIKIIFLTRDIEGHKKSIYKIQSILGGIKKMSYREYLEKYDFHANYYSNLKEHMKRFQDNFSKVGVFNIVNNDTEKEFKKIFKFLGLAVPKDIKWEVFKNDSKTERKRRFLQGVRRKIFIKSPKLHQKIQTVKRNAGFEKY